MKKNFLLILILETLLNFNIKGQPIITSLSAESGPIGFSQYLFVHGKNFGNLNPNLRIYFGGSQGVVWGGSNDTMLRVSPLTGTMFGDICVTDVSTGLTGCYSYPYNATFNCGGQIDSSQFSRKNTISSGGLYPWNIVAGDFDRNGKLDLAVINAWDKVLSIFRNTSSQGELSFDNRIDLFTNDNGTYRLATFDVNSDGRLDIIVTHTNSNRFSVYRNNSPNFDTITFAAPVYFQCAVNPQAVNAGDIDKDGKLDIVIANSGGNTISIFRNTSADTLITFDIRRDFITGDLPYNMTIGDVNNDNQIDVVTINNSGSISILKNNSTSGNISFASKLDLNISGVSVNLSDLDNDKKLDLIVQSNFLKIYKNLSTELNINFTLHDSLSESTSAHFISIGNIDGDSKPEIIIPNQSNNTVSIIESDIQNGVFKLRKKTDISVGKSPYGSCVADLNGDGRPEIIIPNSQDHNIVILKNDVRVPFIVNNVQSICSGDIYRINNKSYTESGLYMDTLISELNCDSIIITDLKVNSRPAKANISITNDSLFSNFVDLNQWYDQDGIIIGANKQYFIPGKSGYYFVIRNNGGCFSDSSNIINVNHTGLNEINSKSDLIIYPNPASDRIIIKTKEYNSFTKITLTSLLGEQWAIGNNINDEIILPNNLKDGIYFISITTNSGLNLNSKFLLKKNN